ncbi:MAG: sodium:proton antiporter [Deltaproteobacteria bacterium]|nr:sodium:proton antiporter [Deltaproteobacteria bacterium]
MDPRRWRFRWLALVLAVLGTACVAQASGAAAEGEGLGAVLPLYSGLPFAGMLLSIALFPLLAPQFWHHHFGKVTAFWGLVLAAPFVVAYRGEAVFEIYHVYVADYVPFLILLWSLYTIAGGILVTGSLSGSPTVNAALLLVGTFVASLVGTTGAAMLLIRPFLRANAWRTRRAYQVVFFIFLVCNIGGSLTPLGDPPLFLGFLHGVPFFWTLQIFSPMALVGALVLGIFFVLDTVQFRREPGRAPEAGGARLKIEGGHNLAFLLAVVLAVLASGLLDLGHVNLFGAHRSVADLLRDGLLIALGLASLATTHREVRERNDFSWAPIQEVAILFAGIFVTMIPVILILKAGSQGAMAFIVEAVKQPSHYFWATGILSSFLDNAPTYLVFLNTALGNFSPGMPEREAIAALIRDHGIYLEAISAGAVFMGANTYIGNAPNFMVRSIAEEAGVEMPSFFGYIFKYSLLFLVPCFLVVTWIFFR